MGEISQKGAKKKSKKGAKKEQSKPILNCRKIQLFKRVKFPIIFLSKDALFEQRVLLDF